MPIDKSLISGSTTMLLLKLLTEKDMYGYEMIENLRKKSNDVLQHHRRGKALPEREGRGVEAICRSSIRSTSTALHKSLRYSTSYLRQEHAREARRRVHYAVASRTHT